MSGRLARVPEIQPHQASSLLQSVCRASRRLRCRRFGGSAVGCYQLRDARQSSQIFEVDVVDTDAQAEMLFELEKQLHELEGVQNAGLEQIGIRSRYLDMEALSEYGAETLDDGWIV